MSQPTEDRLFDLLEKRAVEGLTESEERELEKLSADGDLSLELTAAAISLAGLGKVEPMPSDMRSRIESRADEWFEERQGQTVRANNRIRTERPGLTDGGGIWKWLGWGVAVAACMALGVNVYLTRVNPPMTAGPGPSPTMAPAQLSPRQMRDQLLESAPDIERAEIGPGKEPYKPSGDIVWSDAKQQGFIHVRGLPKNDPLKAQYQLWIFDENQDAKTPVDGGVFDVGSEGDLVIPVDAKIRVKNPKVFAITVEKPGGVVVSKQEKVAALAKVET
jgi:anti-sigma-K factor RskA